MVWRFGESLRGDTTSGRRKFEEHAEERAESTAVQSVGYAFRHGALGTPLRPRYIDRKGSDGKKGELPDILFGILQMGPPKLRTHLYLNSQKCTSYVVMRNEVISFLAAKVGARSHKDDSLEVESMAMGYGKEREKTRQGREGQRQRLGDSAVKF